MLRYTREPMTYSKTLLISLQQYAGGLDFLLLTLLFGTLMVTFCWSALGTRLKLAIYFTTGVFLFRGFFEQLIDKHLFPDLHNYLPFVLGIITTGLLEISAYLLANRTMIIGIFVGGVIFPLLFFSRSSFFVFGNSLVASALIAIAAIIIISCLTMLKITHTKPFQLVTSAIGGAFGTVYLSGLPGGIANFDILGSADLRPISRIMQGNSLHQVILLSISGLFVQLLLHLLARQCQRKKTEPAKYRTRVQDIA
jgi:hypothetical protein